VPTVLVAGSTGVIGCHAAAEFATTPGWRVVTASRGRGCPGAPIDEHVTVDLLRSGDVEGMASTRPDVTHLVFAAGAGASQSGGPADGAVAMLANTLAAFRHSRSLLQHVTVFQSGAAYGAGLGPYKIPAKESDPRLPMTGVDEQLVDLLTESADADGLRWTVLRTDTVIGHAEGGSPNLLLAIAAYASVCRALGLPLRFPGTEQDYRALAQVTDAELLGRAAVWAASAEAAADNVFNVTNGDAFRWCDVWPEIAAVFGMSVAPPAPFPLAAAMADHSDVWDWLVDQYELVPTPWHEIADWDAAAAALVPGFDRLYSTIKIRRAGFAEALDSEARFGPWFERLAKSKVIPPVGGGHTHR